MIVMGFSHDPGPLPFITLRTQKWANRVVPGDYVQIQGEHGCTMPKTPSRVLDVREHYGPVPEHLYNVYRRQKLFEIALVPVEMGAEELAQKFGFPV